MLNLLICVANLAIILCAFETVTVFGKLDRIRKKKTLRSVVVV